MALALWALGLVPLAQLGLRAYERRLGANPIELVTHETGDWAMNFLVLTLCVTPAVRLSGRGSWMRARRHVGLLAFFYACCHLLTWLVLDHFFDWREMLGDVLKRRFITAGMAAFLLMVPLAVTSTDGWIRRLGRRWGTLHKLVYPCAVLAGVHYYWLVKADVRWPVFYLASFGVLLAYRVVR